jgi:hypothetical protein
MVMIPPKTKFDVGDRVQYTGKNSPGTTAIGTIVQSAGSGYLVDFPGGLPRVFMPQELQFLMTADQADDQAHEDQAHKDSLTRTMGGLHSELYDLVSDEIYSLISVAQKDDYGNVRGGVTGDDSIACVIPKLRTALALAEAFEHCKSERERYYGPFVGKGERAPEQGES